MSSKANFNTLNWDVLLAVVEQGLDFKDLLSLKLVSKAFNRFAEDRSPWMNILRNIAQVQPLQIPSYRDPSSCTTLELQEMAIKSSNVYKNFHSENPMPRPSYQVFSVSRGNMVVSMLSIPHTPYIVALMKDGLLVAIDIRKGKWIAQYQPATTVSCWRIEVLDEANVFVILLVGPEDRSSISPVTPGEFITLRLQLPTPNIQQTAQFDTLSSRQIRAPVTAIFVTRDYSGVVYTHHPSMTAHVLVSLLQGQEAQHVIIDTEVPVSLKVEDGLNATTTQSHLVLFGEDGQNGELYSYDMLLDFKPLFNIASSKSPINKQPSFNRRYHYPALFCHPSAVRSYTIVRTQWKPSYHFNSLSTDRISVLVMSYISGDDFAGDGPRRCMSHISLEPFSDRELLNPTTTQTATVSIKTEHQTTSSPSIPTTGPTSARKPTPGPQKSEESQTPRDSIPIKRDFHSCLEVQDDIWHGPGGNDLISAGYGGYYNAWIAMTERGPVLKLASLVADARKPDPSGEPCQHVVRTLQLPSSIYPHGISAIALDDVNGKITLATIHHDIWVLDYAVPPSRR